MGGSPIAEGTTTQPLRLPERKRAVILTPRDLEILRSVNDHHVLDHALLALLFPPDPEARARGAEIRRRPAAAENGFVPRRPGGPNDFLARRLRLLTVAGFLAIPQAARGLRNARAVYALAPAGARALLDAGLAAADDVSAILKHKTGAGSWGTLDHDLAVARAHVLIIGAAQARGLATNWVRHPRRETHLRYEVSSRERLEPDGYLKIEAPGEGGGKPRVYHHFLEVQRSSDQGMARRYARYAKLFRARGARPDLAEPGAPLFPAAGAPEDATELWRTVTFARDATYRDRLRRAAATLKYGGLLFATLDDLTPQRVLARVYFTPRGAEPVPLL